MNLEAGHGKHVVRLPRQLVERLERRAELNARHFSRPGRYADPDKARALSGAGCYLRALLRERKWTGKREIEIEMPANWFGWACREIADGEIGLAIGLQLALSAEEPVTAQRRGCLF